MCSMLMQTHLLRSNEFANTILSGPRNLRDGFCRKTQAIVFASP